ATAAIALSVALPDALPICLRPRLRPPPRGRLERRRPGHRRRPPRPSPARDELAHTRSGLVVHLLPGLGRRAERRLERQRHLDDRDRKSTRLNSSHVTTSYA